MTLKGNAGILKPMTHPEYHEFDEFKTRSQKLKEIEALGIDPYPHKFEPEISAHALVEKYEGQEVGHSEDGADGKTDEVTVAGRMVLFRAMGKNAFGHIQDDTGRLQIMFNRDLTKVTSLSDDAEIKHIKFIEKKIDLGDIVGIRGHLFRTQKGELTVFAKEVTLLCKTLLPLPDKHSGLVDKGVRYRKRWLDLISNPDVMAAFKQRSKIHALIRQYCTELDFLEVETPILQNNYGGAEARPFITKLNALQQEMFMRISLEIPLKKLLVGGIPRVFEMGKVFRNEGLDRTHNPEFTELEVYAAYWDYNDVMEFTENLFEYIAIKLFGTSEIGMRYDKQGKPHEISLKTPWKRLTMKESIKAYGGIEVEGTTDAEMRDILISKTELKKEDVKDLPRGKLIQALFEELVEHHLIQPHHITDHPIETTPLCKLHREPRERAERMVERFESFILGFEFCNAYSELNDPVLQRELLSNQAEMRDSGDDEAHPMDEEFIEAICQGMPPAGGLGIGVDRLTMLFNNETSIRDVLFFPIMRPEE